jgi:nucleoside-diphosphate-sugar epimerase
MFAGGFSDRVNIGVFTVRISTRTLEGIRRERSSRILVTGGTGFLGSHVASRLLDAGFKVTIAARSLPEADATERVRRIMDWHGITDEARRRLRVVPCDFLDPALGLSPGERDRLLREVDEIIHCASETSFAERRRARVEEVNLRGTERMLQFAAAGRCVAFQYLSTAFAAGRREGLCPESLSPASEFHNAYEETKCRAERMVWQRCRDEGIRAVIYRPSIVYGHSVTGRSLLFNAVYHPVRAAVFLRNVYLKDIREKRGERAQTAGVKIGPNGITLHLPLRVEAEGPGIDLIPVDFFARAFDAIFETALDGGIFHIVQGRPTAIAAIAAFTSRMFELSGVEVVSAADLDGTPRNTIEAAFAQMIDVYRPYLSDRRLFATAESGPILKRIGLSCPSFTYDVFRRCMSFAVAAGWRGKDVVSQNISGRQ